MNVEEFEFNCMLFNQLMDLNRSHEAKEVLIYLVSEPKSSDVCDKYQDQINSLTKGYTDLMYVEYEQMLPLKPKEAMKTLSKTLNYTNSPIVFMGLSKCAVRLGLTDLARVYSAKAILAAKDDVSIDVSDLEELQAMIEHADKKYDSALSYMRASCQHNNCPDKQYKLAQYLIEDKQFSEGWSLYESRFIKKVSPAPYPDLGVPRWHLGTKAHKLLVHWEQGFGDTIMFSRFLPELTKHADEVYFAVRLPMKQLMSENFPMIKVVLDTNIPEDIDYHVPLMSLMKELCIQPSDISGKPYLDTRNIISCTYASQDKRVGLSWQGSVAGMPERNMDLIEFAPLLEKRKDLTFISFQKGFGLAAAEPLFQDLNILDMGSKLVDFHHTASVLKTVGLFITTDNCLANLAGALGVHTILLLHSEPEFRWMRANSKTVWYDSVEIIKQDKYGDWKSCVSKVLERI